MNLFQAALGAWHVLPFALLFLTFLGILKLCGVTFKPRVWSRTKVYSVMSVVTLLLCLVIGKVQQQAAVDLFVEEVWPSMSDNAKQAALGLAGEALDFGVGVVHQGLELGGDAMDSARELGTDMLEGSGAAAIRTGVDRLREIELPSFGSDDEEENSELDEQESLPTPEVGSDEPIVPELPLFPNDTPSGEDSEIVEEDSSGESRLDQLRGLWPSRSSEEE